MSWIDDYNAMPSTGQIAQQTQPKQAPQPKKSGGIKGFLENALPTIGAGLGAVAGIPLDIFGGAGSIAGGAAGGSLGEALKEKLTGQKESLKQIGIQGLEGGVGAAIQPAKLLKGGSSIAKSFVTGGADLADNTATKTATTAATDASNTGNSFLKNLTTQGQQAQGRISGISAGSKVAGKELTPQDTAQMLGTLKNEGIQTGNANNTLRDISDRLNTYGKQISDHFTTNNAPLHADDTKQIADNFVSTLPTTDPAVVKQAQIIGNDLQKNVNSTKDLWNFRKTLDSKIPDSKFMDEATTAKVTALKSARQYISNELGEAPGMNNYSKLAEIKPFVSAEAKRLNNPSGGVVGRVLSSGPAQAAENFVGKTTEKIGQKGANKAASTAADDALQTATAPTQATPVGTGFMNKLIKTGKGAATFPLRAAAAPLAYPVKSTGAVLKQGALKGFGIGNALNAAQGQNQQSQSTDNTAPDLSSTLLQSSAANPTPSDNPYDPSNAEANVQAILQQGGTSTDVSNYLAAVKAYQGLQTSNVSTTGASKPTAQQYGLATSGYNSLQQIAQIIQDDPTIIEKNAVPGQTLPLVGSLVSNAAGASNYHALVDNVAQAIGHLQTGATATAEEVKAVKGQFPQPGDSQATVNQKLQTIAKVFQPFLGNQ